MLIVQTYHNFIEANVPRMSCKHLGLWINHWFLDNADKVRLEEPFAPFRNAIRLGYYSFAIECAIISNLPLDCVFCQNVRREWIWVALPETLQNLFPVVMEYRGCLVIFRHAVGLFRFIDFSLLKNVAKEIKKKLQNKRFSFWLYHFSHAFY